MLGYTASEIVPRDVHELFERVRRRVQEMPLRDREDNLVTCHAVAIALAGVDPAVRAQHGYFARYGARHSWLRVSGTTWLIDPYPIAQAGGPIMVDVVDYSPWAGLYTPHVWVERYVAGDPEVDEQVAFLRDVLRDVG